MPKEMYLVHVVIEIFKPELFTLEKLRNLYNFLKVQFFTDTRENVQINSFYFLEIYVNFLCYRNKNYFIFYIPEL